MRVYYDRDCDVNLIKDKKVAILGYGSQGHAHALNLKDSGVDVRVGLQEGSRSRAKAEGAGLRVTTVKQAAQEADLVMVLAPDQSQRRIYDEEIRVMGATPRRFFSSYRFSLNGEKMSVAMVDLLCFVTVSSTDFADFRRWISVGPIPRGDRDCQNSVLFEHLPPAGR